MYLSSFIHRKSTGFVRLCRSHGVKKLYAFGSSITRQFNEEESDIDLIVEVDIPDPVKRGETLLLLWDELEIFFERKVDLLTENSIKNPYLKQEIDRTKQIIYDGEREKIFI